MHRVSKATSRRRDTQCCHGRDRTEQFLLLLPPYTAQYCSSSSSSLGTIGNIASAKEAISSLRHSPVRLVTLLTLAFSCPITMININLCLICHFVTVDAKEWAEWVVSGGRGGVRKGQGGQRIPFFSGTAEEKAGQCSPPP